MLHVWHAFDRKAQSVCGKYRAHICHNAHAWGTVCVLDAQYMWYMNLAFLTSWKVPKIAVQCSNCPNRSKCVHKMVRARIIIYCTKPSSLSLKTANSMPLTEGSILHWAIFFFCSSSTYSEDHYHQTCQYNMKQNAHAYQPYVCVHDKRQTLYEEHIYSIQLCSCEVPAFEYNHIF